MRAHFSPLVPALLAHFVAALQDLDVAAAGAAHSLAANWAVGSLRHEGKLGVDVTHCVVNEGVVAVRLLHHAVHNPHAMLFICAHSVLPIDAGNRPG